MKKIIFLLVPCSLLLVPCTYAQNTGIGTSSPLFKLDVKNGSINTDSVYRIGGNSVLSANFQNTFVGIGAASSITTGNFNTAMGNEALFSNTTGERNTAFGLWSLRGNISGSFNTAIGKSALHENLTGSFNTATGYEVLYYNLASANTAYGYRAMLFNTTGFSNTANGFEALNRNTAGFYNTAFGYQSLLFNTTGSYNTAIGYRALYANLGLNNTGLGNTATGVGALQFNTTGLYNAAYGVDALNENITGSYNTAIGTFAEVSSDNLSNATALGYRARVGASDRVRIGNSFVNSIGGQASWTTFSDGRYKQNVQEDVPGIAFINKLRPVTYTVDVKSLDENYYKPKPGMYSTANTSYRHTGFIAQEVENSATELGFSFSGVDKPQQADNLYGLRYAEFVVPLVKAVQELSKQNDDLKNQNIELLKRIEKMESLFSSKIKLYE